MKKMLLIILLGAVLTACGNHSVGDTLIVKNDAVGTDTIENYHIVWENAKNGSFTEDETTFSVLEGDRVKILRKDNNEPLVFVEVLEGYEEGESFWVAEEALGKE
ncbi:hypothetical protein [Lederbergia lenta]|uniref:hypothetical protein n=1 Tax=Lederbergia lenta TaxID=1467 RepID=UPI002040B65F|nr:hypothetical protein [Lederbergia lenta]MCM3109965.1 hypothetical protein [Lederbergia lenta]